MRKNRHTRNCAMPFVCIAMRQARGFAHRKAISSGIHQALVETFDVPQDDLFMAIRSLRVGKDVTPLATRRHVC